MKVLLATEKPFAKEAVEGIKQIFDAAGIETVLLEKYTDKSQILAAAAHVEGMIVRSDKVDKDVIEAAKQLKIVVRAGAGYDNLDLAACTAAKVVAMNTPGQNSNAVAELALGMMVYMARNSFEPGTGIELKGKKLGIHAYGNVGRLVAQIAQGFGMDVYAFDAFVRHDQMMANGVKPCDTVDELYATCQYISLHIPATAETKQSINAALLAKLPKNGTLINTARKEVIHEQELMQMMEQRTDLRYATDIAPANHAEMAAKYGTRYFATEKKMGAETAEANINAGLAAANQIVAFLNNGDTKFQVNK